MSWKFVEAVFDASQRGVTACANKAAAMNARSIMSAERFRANAGRRQARHERAARERSLMPARHDDEVRLRDLDHAACAARACANCPLVFVEVAAEHLPQV